jgi:hypothetical protein
VGFSGAIPEMIPGMKKLILRKIHNLVTASYQIHAVILLGLGTVTVHSLLEP